MRQKVIYITLLPALLLSACTQKEATTAGTIPETVPAAMTERIPEETAPPPTDPPPVPTNRETQPPSAAEEEETPSAAAEETAQAVPAIEEAYITTEQMLMEVSPGVYEYGDIFYYYLHVRGDFACYEVKLRVMGAEDISRQYDRDILLTAGAGLDVECDITPYFEDGTAGETVHCTQNG